VRYSNLVTPWFDYSIQEITNLRGTKLREPLIKRRSHLNLLVTLQFYLVILGMLPPLVDYLCNFYAKVFPFEFVRFCDVFILRFRILAKPGEGMRNDANIRTPNNHDRWKTLQVRANLLFWGDGVAQSTGGYKGICLMRVNQSCARLSISAECLV